MPSAAAAIAGGLQLGDDSPHSLQVGVGHHRHRQRRVFAAAVAFSIPARVPPCSDKCGNFSSLVHSCAVVRRPHRRCVAEGSGPRDLPRGDAVRDGAEATQLPSSAKEVSISGGIVRAAYAKGNRQRMQRH